MIFSYFFGVSFSISVYIVLVWYFLRGKYGQQSLNIGLISAFSSAFGAKWSARFLEGFSPLENITEYFSFWRGGDVFVGGLILGVTSTLIWSVYKRKSPLDVFDDLTKPAALGYAFYRIAVCFLTGCCYGKPYVGKLSASFKPLSPAYNRYGNYPLYPTQLYEAGIGIIIFVLLMLTENRIKNKKGYKTALFISSYAFLRTIVEFLRGDISERFYIFTVNFKGIWGIDVWQVAIITVGCLYLFFLWTISKKQGNLQERNNEPNQILGR